MCGQGTGRRHFFSMPNRCTLSGADTSQIERVSASLG